MVDVSAELQLRFHILSNDTTHTVVIPEEADAIIVDRPRAGHPGHRIGVFITANAYTAFVDRHPETPRTEAEPVPGLLRHWYEVEAALAILDGIEDGLQERADGGVT